jgi:methylmalonyl-CoA mutase C-terminal domain/subunit
VVDLLRKSGMDGVKVFMGGVIPPHHIPLLKAKGIHEVYGPDTAMAVIVTGIRNAVARTQP